MLTTTPAVPRRAFLGAAATFAASAALPRCADAAATSRPNSRFNGVQIGVIRYSFRSLPESAEEVLDYAVRCGISSIELMGNTAEQFAGAPAVRKGEPKPLLDWRLAASMDPFRELREMYAAAGVGIHIVKFPDIGNANMPFGEGDTPIAEALRFMRANRLAFPADIELEYKIPDGSDAVREVATCVAFCRKSLD